MHARALRSLAFATLVSALVFPANAGAQPVSATGDRAPSAVEVPQHPGQPGAVRARHPLMLKVRGYDAQGKPLFASGAPGGYTAAQLRASVGLQGTGNGQTVAVVDAYDDPYATQDLNAYSAQMGLPGVCKGNKTKGCFSFTRLAPYGVGGLDAGWATETALDLEMIHTMAPDASIVLVEAVDNQVDSLFQADDYAASLHPAAISNSWGVDGEDPTETTYDSHCRLADSVCVFSAGDSGNPGGYPAYNPSVLAVGGTRLSLDRAGNVLGETAWAGSGGGVSQYEPRPAYQPATLNPNAGRGIPDVSFDADPLTGVAVYATVYNGWLEVGGTSVGAPAWSGILAAADELRAAAGKPALTAANAEVQHAVYQTTSGLADITDGSNGSCADVCTAKPGYDFITGLGSPRSGIDTALAAAP